MTMITRRLGCAALAGLALLAAQAGARAADVKIGFLGGFMNLGGNIGGIAVPIIVGAIVQLTHSYFLALMFFAAAGIGLLVCSSAIDYEKKIPV